MKVEYTSQIEGDADDGFDIHFNDELIGHRDTIGSATLLLTDSIKRYVETEELKERQKKEVFRLDCDAYSLEEALVAAARELGFTQYHNEWRTFVNQHKHFDLDCRLDRDTNIIYVRAFNGVLLVHETPLKIENDES